MGEGSIGALGLGAPAGRSGSRSPPWSPRSVRGPAPREALNRALHELRRPLQALVLASGASRGRRARMRSGSRSPRSATSTARSTAARRRFEPRPVACRAVVRVRGRALAGDRRRVQSVARPALARRLGAWCMADPERLAQALDNLIHNAIRHGGLRVRVEARAFAAGVRISVADSGAVRPAGAATGDPRHGHGLRVVAAVAAEHGGRFLVRPSADRHRRDPRAAVRRRSHGRPAAGRASRGPAGRMPARPPGPWRGLGEPPRPGDRLRVRGARLRGPGGDARRRLSQRHPEPARSASPRGRRRAAVARGEPASGRRMPERLLEVRRIPERFVPAGDARGARRRRSAARRAGPIPPAPTCSPRSSGIRGSAKRHGRRRASARGREPVQISVTGAEALAATGRDPQGTRVDVIVTTEPGPGGGSGRTRLRGPRGRAPGPDPVGRRRGRRPAGTRRGGRGMRRSP